jgi:hypothetical protein
MIATMPWETRRAAPPTPLATALRTAALAIVLLLAMAIPASAAQSTDVTSSASPLADPAQVISVKPSPGAPQSPGSPTGTSSEPATTATPKTKAQQASALLHPDSGYANAAKQSYDARKAEAKRDCVANRPPVSRMISGGTVGVDDGPSWHALVLPIGIATIVLAIVAFALRHGLSPRGKTPDRGALETVTTLVGVLATIVGLAVQFVPGFGVKDRPPPQATMKVRDVDARITRGEYAKALRVREKLAQIDRREVGDVVWLQVGLQGYAGKRLSLQYAMYDSRAGGPLLPGTEKQIPLTVENRDEQTSFVPVWIGYPKIRKFKVQFRLLSGGPPQVRQMASTGPMRGSSYRYACGYGNPARS